MTRFREEVYASPWYRKAVRVQRANHPLNPQSGEGSAMAVERARRTLRSEYFKKKAQKAYNPSEAQKRMNLDA